MTTVADQADVVAWLGSSEAHGGAEVEQIETHASMVFVAGDRAWKIKRAVKYDYLDFSTVERRKAACEGEVRINRRTAPAIYLGTVPVTRRGDGAFAFGGDGPAVEWAIEMVRFDQAALLDRLAARGALDLALMPALAAEIARFHGVAAPRTDHGGVAGMTWVVDGNADGFAREGRGVCPAGLAARVTAAARAAIARHAALLDARRAGGFVRECHGDLHLRNIVVLDERPTLFDGVEFNDEISCVDVLYDLSFLLMDLWQHGLERHAHAVLNAYVAITHDFEGLALLPLYLSCRAAVRAKVAATAAHVHSEQGARDAQARLARDYLSMADALLRHTPPCGVAVGGLSGTGKSTLAATLAPALGPVPGAILLRNDAVRKELAGVDATTRLGPEHYTVAASARVYAAVAERATAVLRAGHTAVVDGVFARPADREAIEQAVTATGVPFAGLWLDAPAGVLLARIGARRGDVSDADDAVVQAQVEKGAGQVAWARVDASGTPEVVLRRASDALRSRVPSAYRDGVAPHE
jgi:aminoglycoside phosphotransferase family enzyme/predicted kinase